MDDWLFKFFIVKHFFQYSTKFNIYWVQLVSNWCSNDWYYYCKLWFPQKSEIWLSIFSKYLLTLLERSIQITLIPFITSWNITTWKIIANINTHDNNPDSVCQEANNFNFTTTEIHSKGALLFSVHNSSLHSLILRCLSPR